MATSGCGTGDDQEGDLRHLEKKTQDELDDILNRYVLKSFVIFFLFNALQDARAPLFEGRAPHKGFGCHISTRGRRTYYKIAKSLRY